MVCKENVVSWFGNLSSYKRIDVMCTLLNKCVPFEVRYLGTCVEEIGKRDYNELRESEHHANSESDLGELTTLGVGDKRTRRKLVLYMALLHSSNYGCADILHKILASLESPDVFSSVLSVGSYPPEDQPLEELMLLYTMALNHPAFTYDQKTSITNVYLKLQEEESRLSVPKQPAASVNSSYKTAQGCGPCAAPNEQRSVSADSGVEMPANCSMPPPPMQTYHGEIPMRNNAMVSGVPPGLTLPPPGLCLPGPEQMSMGTTPGAQYLHLGYPMSPWQGQVMMGNQLMYHTGEMLAYPPSPLVSRQSSPSQSRSPSRSNSPLGRRNNQMPRTSSQVTQSTSNTLTTSVSASNSQSSIASSNPATHHPPPTISLGCTTRSLPGGQSPMLPPRSAPPPITSTSSVYSRHNSIDNTSTVAAPMTSTKQQPPPPPRLRSSTSGESIRESQPKDMTNFKGNLQNTSLDEIRRMSDEDLKEIGLPPNVVGQLRSIVRSQTTNGLSQLGMEKKLEGTNSATHPVVDQIDNEEPQQQQMQQQSQQQQSLPQQQPLQQQQQQQMHIPHNHANAANIRRYPTMPTLDPATMQMYPPPPIYPSQNPPCYGCIPTVPVAGMQSRYTRCNGQNLYCIAQIQALRLDPESSRHCSQSSSSESTGSRSPPETPPAAPWANNNAPESSAVAAAAPPTSSDHSGSGSSHHSTVVVSHPAVSQPMQQIPERPRNQSKKNQSHVMRQKNQMVNGASGGGNGSTSGSGGGCAVPPNIPHCGVSFSGPPTPSVTFLQHAHFPALRPSTGIYSNFSHAAYARPTYHAAYQPNGEMMYQYPGQPGPGGTPPPPTVAAPPQTYIPSAPVTPYTPASQSAKISCYNCGSCSHLASECKDQTMEELTKRAPYRLDYTIMKQSGDPPSSDK